jgi:hypothetical protein
MFMSLYTWEWGIFLVGVRRIFAGTLLLITLFLGGCASDGSGDRPNFPNEVQSLQHQPILSRDDRKLRLGDRPAYVLMDLSTQGTWSITQISDHPLTPSRDNQEVLLVDSWGKNIFPAFEGTQFNFDEDPITGNRTNFRAAHDWHKNPYPLPKQDRKKGYTIGSSAFAATLFTARRVGGDYVGFNRHYIVHHDTLRSSITETNLIQKVKEFWAGDRSLASPPPAIRPLGLINQIWLVTPTSNENLRFYLTPEEFLTETGNIIESGSFLGVFAQKKLENWDSFRRFHVYGGRRFIGRSGSPREGVQNARGDGH